MWKHIEAVHEGVADGVEFDMKVIRRFKNDPCGSSEICLVFLGHPVVC